MSFFSFVGLCFYSPQKTSGVLDAIIVLVLIYAMKIQNDYYEKIKQKEHGESVEATVLNKIASDPLMPPLKSVQD